MEYKILGKIAKFGGELNYDRGELRIENLNSLWGETGITPLELSTQSSFITHISDQLYYGNYN